MGGFCVGTDCPVDCSAYDGAQGCLVGACDPLTGACSAQAMPSGAPCDDGDPCTTNDACQSGTCRGVTKDCTELDDACLVGSCDASTGACQAVAASDGTPCNDKDSCSGHDACAGGLCQGAFNLCAACAGKLAGDACDDGDPCAASTGVCVQVADGLRCEAPKKDCSGSSTVCEIGVCDAVTGSCVAVARPEGAACDDGDTCTNGDSCTTLEGADAPVCAGSTVEMCGDVAPDFCEPVVSNKSLADAIPLDEPVTDELSLLSLNYTSGTTGTPKGVMYHHRGAYLQALAMVAHAGLDARSRYLWTLPMFHCNGWAFTWAVTAAGGTHVAMRELDPDLAWDHLRDGVTHFCGAPTVLTMLATAEGARPLDTRVRAFTGGAPPTPAMLEELGEHGIRVEHLYGLTESYGPAVLCDWHPEWDELPAAEQAELMARQGVGNVTGNGVRVVDTATGEDVPRDAATIGEILLRGNTMMAGYLDDEAATAAATLDGWFRTGDLAVVHDDGYVDIRDRAKDIIVSGGENVSSVEVERVLVRHPAVLECAVVGVPHDHWGERPHAHVTLRAGADTTADELRAFVREHLAGYKVPDEVVFGELPKTSTGKVQKHVLRSDRS